MTNELHKRAVFQRQADMTIYERLPVWASMALANLHAIAVHPTVDHLAGCLAGQPAVSIAPGPSLDATIEYVAGLHGHAVVIALAHAVPALAARGISPDIVISCESIDQSEYLAGVDWQAVSLLALVAQAHPALYALPARRIVTYTSNISTEWLERAIGHQCELDAGNTTASVAWGLAVLLGCDPVLLVGHDLAFVGDRKYATGVNGLAQAETVVPCRGQAGEQLVTNITFARQREWFEERARAGHRIVNCSPGGAQIDGVPNGHLDQAAAEYQRVVSVDVEAAFTSHLDGLDLSQQVRDLRAWCARTGVEVEDSASRARALTAEATKAGESVSAMHALERCEAKLSAALTGPSWLLTTGDPRRANQIRGIVNAADSIAATVRASSEIATYVSDMALELRPRLMETEIALGRTVARVPYRSVSQDTRGEDTQAGSGEKGMKDRGNRG